MDDPQVKSKMNQDAARVKKDTSILVGDSSVQFSRFENNLSQASEQAKEDISTWVEDGISQVSKEIEKLADDARDSAVDSAATVKKDIGHGLSQYNTEVQKVANKISDDFGKKASGYPWVIVTIALVLGFLLGILLSPIRQSSSQSGI
jgi:ElaB/YqjD/DUF883 family membrane-anchored ribosome-binding protein